MNTVLLTGKGYAVKLTLLALQQAHYPHATWTEPELRWWQSTPRYELRIQNLSSSEIRNINELVNGFRPFSSLIKISVF